MYTNVVKFVYTSICVAHEGVYYGNLIYDTKYLNEALNIMYDTVYEKGNVSLGKWETFDNPLPNMESGKIKYTCIRSVLSVNVLSFERRRVLFACNSCYLFSRFG